MTLFPDAIRTRRLLLRRPQPEDAGQIFLAYAQDPQVCRFLMWTPHPSVEATREFIDTCIDAWAKGQHLPYVLVDSVQRAPIGMIEARFTQNAVDIGYVLARSRWGEGLMPEAAQTLIAEIFSQTAIHRIEATSDVENIASIRTLEKCGFIRETFLPRHAIHPNLSSEPRDCVRYTRLRSVTPP